VFIGVDVVEVLAVFIGVGLVEVSAAFIGVGVVEVIFDDVELTSVRNPGRTGFLDEHWPCCGRTLILGWCMWW